MNSRLFFQSSSLILFIIITLVILVQIPVFLCFNWYSSCGNPSLFLSCKANITFIEINNVKYCVLGVNTATKSLKIARADFNGGVCSLNHVNTTLDSNLFVYRPGYGNITFVYGCRSHRTGMFTCPGSGDGVIVMGAQGPDTCNVSVVVPILQTNNTGNIGNLTKMEEAIKEGFEVNWKVDNESCSVCIQSKGICGYDVITNQSTCYCEDQSYGLKPCPLFPTMGAPQTLS